MRVLSCQGSSHVAATYIRQVVLDKWFPLVYALSSHDLRYRPRAITCAAHAVRSRKTYWLHNMTGMLCTREHLRLGRIGIENERER